MSATDNKKLMQDIFAAIAAGDRSMFLDSLADDVVMRVTGKNSWSRTFEGKVALVRDLYGYLNTLLVGGRRTVAHRFMADGDHVVIEASGEMMTKAGVRYENEYCLVYRLERGKIVEIREYLDSALCEAVLGKFPEDRPCRADWRSVTRQRRARSNTHVLMVRSALLGARLEPCAEQSSFETRPRGRASG
jgi:ketosteroid isomerase-like protein